VARRPPSRPGLRLGALAIVLIALYSSMIGSGRLTPPLGLDLRGGTSVTLTPQATNGVKPSKQQLDTAVDIIRQRVNGLGVSGADVVTQGTNVVISVPGKGRSAVLNQVGQTAALSFREIYTDSSGNQYIAANPTPTTSVSPTTTASPTTSATGSPSAKTSVSVSSGAGITIAPSSSATTAASPTTSGSSHNRPLTQALTAASTSPTPTPTVTATPTTTNATQAPAATSSAPVGVVQSASAAPTTGAKAPAEVNQTAPSAALLAAFSTLDCSKNGGRPPDNLVDDDPHHFVVACDSSGQSKYLLTPADILGTDVSTAEATIGQTSTGASTGQWEVDVTFKDSAVSLVTSVSTRLFNDSEKQLAIVLDGVVVSAPSTDAVLGKDIEISGSSAAPFTEKAATDLANSLKYGSLPVAFTRSTAETVSATLGRSSLHAGLLAGALGLGLVLIYVFLYYRMLGFVTVASLVTSGLLVYASITLLGAAIGYSLSLPGIAGLIVSIGITADSFVVFFERLKDEMRDGRSPRLAVEYGWVRARRTIFTADTVSFLAAVILYVVSVGDVKGFAFTLGLSTFLDIVVVLLFTKPLMTLLIRFPIFSTSTKSGISAGRIGRRAVTREA
jgi:preprotein translocase subunit SecD